MATKTSKGVMMENKKRSVKTKSASATRREAPKSKRKVSQFFQFNSEVECGMWRMDSERVKVGEAACTSR